MSDPAYLRGRYGTYRVATIAEVDRRLAMLVKLLPAATPASVRRIRHDMDMLLDRRLALTKR